MVCLCEVCIDEKRGHPGEILQRTCLLRFQRSFQSDNWNLWKGIGCVFGCIHVCMNAPLYSSRPAQRRNSSSRWGGENLLVAQNVVPPFPQPIVVSVLARQRCCRHDGAARTTLPLAQLATTHTGGIPRLVFGLTNLWLPSRVDKITKITTPHNTTLESSLARRLSV